MNLNNYKKIFLQTLKDRTAKSMPTTLGLTFIFIFVFALTDTAFFQRDYFFWRGIGLLITAICFVLSRIKSLKTRIDPNYLFSAGFIGVLIMMEGIFVETILLNDSLSADKMAVTIGIASVYFIFNILSSGAKKEFAVVSLVSLLPILIFSLLYFTQSNIGYLLTIYSVAITFYFTLRSTYKNELEQYVTQKKLESSKLELLKKQKELEGMNEELRSFNHSISHDFKTPIRAVNSFSQLLARDISLKNYHKIDQYVGFISGSMKKMNSLLEALNAVSDISKKPVDFVKMDLEPVLRDAMNEVAFDFDKKYEFYIAEDLPVIFGDKILLRDVFTNIFSNALKYSRYQSKVIINVGYYQEGDETVIFIKDNGIGFKMAYKDQLFEMFKRLHNDEQFQGNGIGLSIVKRIMGFHHGEVWASSLSGNGATFYLSFPRYIPELEVAL